MVENSEARIYSFHDIAACNMCGANADRFALLGMRLDRSQGSNPKSVSGIATSVMRCEDCGLIFANPQPVPASLMDHYALPAEDYWLDNRAVGDLLPEDLALFEEMRRKQSSLDRPVALDVGTGTGNKMRAMEAVGYEAHGFEPIPHFLDVAKRATGLPEERFRPYGIEDADYPPGSFDLVNFGAVLEHLYDPAEALRKAMSWLRPGGLVYAEIPSARHLVSRIINRYFRLRGTNFVTHLSPMHSPFHLYEFEERCFVAHGKAVGYSLDDVEYRVCSIYHLPRLLHPMLRWIMRRNRTGMQMHVILKKL